MADYDTTEEYELMVQAGMDGRQIPASLTTAPAARFGDSKCLGRIAPGFVADLVVLNKDPVQDVRAFAAVRCTIRDGRLIYNAKTTRLATVRASARQGKAAFGELVPRTTNLLFSGAK